MNLGRAKLVLIVAFVGLNLFLGYHLFWPDFGRLTRVAITAEEMRITEAMLTENNYYLEVPLDRSIQTIDFITVSPAVDFQNKIRNRLIEEDALYIEQDDNLMVYYGEGESVFIYPTGLIKVIYDPGYVISDGLINLEQREIRSKIELFLEKKTLKPEGIVFDYLERVETGQGIIYYYQVHDNIPIYSGYLKVVIDLDKIIEVEVFWLEFLERSPVREIEVISATVALTNLVKEIGSSSEPQRIKQVDLGFFSHEYDAEKWEIPPVWRINLEGPRIYYINAFTGNLEQEIIIPEQLP
jgi:regulatory protein YycI of two-component signal transduction system YycFG